MTTLSFDPDNTLEGGLFAMSPREAIDLAIALVLYTALNKGVMPFFETPGEHSSEERATALQSRMKGEILPFPATASRELGVLVRRAAAFRAQDRYATPGQLKAALESLPEAAGIPSSAPVIAAAGDAVHTYKVDKDFEKTEPDRQRRQKREKREKGAVDENMDAEEFRKTKKKSRWLLPVLLVAIIVAALILLLQSCNDGIGSPGLPVSSPPIGTDGIHSPVPETTAPILVTTEPPATPEPTETTEPTEPPEPRFELFLADTTWEQARDLCEQKGGHLATVRTQEQLDEIIELAKQNGASFVWLGASRSTNGQWYYVTGDALDFSVWDNGEPSAIDGDGTREDYLLLWYRAKVDRWSYNDMRNDPISVAAGTYRGKLSYVCQYD